MDLQLEKYYKLCEIDGYIFSARTWRRKIKEGELQCLKCGGVFIKGEWIVDFLNEHTMLNKCKK